MSLFGTSPDEGAASRPAASRSVSKSLFDDDPPAAKSASSLFADAGIASTDSPWSMPTPKKAGRSDLVKNLLPATDVPESYIEAFDALLETEYGLGGGVSLDGLRKLLESTAIGKDEQARLLKMVTPGGADNTGLGRNEFNVLLALTALAQEGGEEATLDGVDDRRKSLPQPDLPYLQRLTKSLHEQPPSNLQSPVRTPSRSKSSVTNSPSKLRRSQRDSFNENEVDPWASPATLNTTSLTRPVHNEATPSRNSVTMARPIKDTARTTSSFTTHSDDPDDDSKTNQAPSGLSSATSGSGWGTYDASTAEYANGDNSLLRTGFGGEGPGGSSDRASAALGGSRPNRGVEETVTITALPEKEGTFLFQHRNYEVKSARRASSVIRRYSDFVWLLDCMHKRYPFRQLPLLPPKTVGVNGRHLSSDNAFIEKRRRGLVRFTNTLVRHPVLCQEQLVVMFLTVPTELAVWRKQATISVQEEFAGKSLPPGLEDSLPTNLQDTFDTVRSGVRRSAESYIGLCNLLERLIKRNQGIAADSLRFSQALRLLTDDSEPTYASDTNDVPLLNEGIKATAKHLETSHSLIEDESRAWDEGVLEDFKRQRDVLVSVRDVFDRRDRLAKNTIPQLERRIEANESKLNAFRAKPDVKPGEQEKVEQAILNDKQSIVNQHARGVFILECVRDELLFFQQSQYHVSRLHQDWSQERVKYSELQADNWRALNEEVENMPMAE